MRAVGRINLDEPQVIAQGLTELVAQLRQRYAIEAVYAFGSYARDELHEGSDVDVLIIGEIPGRFHERIGHVLELTSLPVEPLVYTPAEFRQLQGEGHPLIMRALAEGRRLDPSPLPASLSTRERQALQWLKAYLAHELGERVNTVRLFGSRARGEGHPHSDLDVALIVDRADDRAEDVAWDAMVEIMGRFNVTCETIVFGEADYARALDDQEPLILNIESEGITV